jgi:hypothetical protein
VKQAQQLKEELLAKAAQEKKQLGEEEAAKQALKSSLSRLHQICDRGLLVQAFAILQEAPLQEQLKQAAKQAESTPQKEVEIKPAAKESPAAPAAVALAQANAERRKIVMEGVLPGEHQHDLMGVYELIDGKVVNGRGVWQKPASGGLTGPTVLVYSARKGEWQLVCKEKTAAGSRVRGGRVSTKAVTPDRATSLWNVDDSDTTGMTHAAPKLRARVWVEGEDMQHVLGASGTSTGDVGNTAGMSATSDESQVVHPPQSPLERIAMRKLEDGKISHDEYMQIVAGDRTHALLGDADEEEQEKTAAVLRSALTRRKSALGKLRDGVITEQEYKEIVSSDMQHTQIMEAEENLPRSVALLPLHPPTSDEAPTVEAISSPIPPPNPKPIGLFKEGVTSKASGEEETEPRERRQKDANALEEEILPASRPASNSFSTNGQRKRNFAEGEFALGFQATAMVQAGLTGAGTSPEANGTPSPSSPPTLLARNYRCQLVKKSKSESWGLELHEDCFNDRILIRRIVPGGLAEQEGSIQPGDYLLEVDDTSVQAVGFEDIIAHLTARGAGVGEPGKGDFAAVDLLIRRPPSFRPSPPGSSGQRDGAMSMFEVSAGSHEKSVPVNREKWGPEFLSPVGSRQQARHSNEKEKWGSKYLSPVESGNGGGSNGGGDWAVGQEVLTPAQIQERQEQAHKPNPFGKHLLRQSPGQRRGEGPSKATEKGDSVPWGRHKLRSTSSSKGRRGSESMFELGSGRAASGVVDDELQRKLQQRRSTIEMGSGRVSPGIGGRDASAAGSVADEELRQKLFRRRSAIESFSPPDKLSPRTDYSASTTPSWLNKRAGAGTETKANANALDTKQREWQGQHNWGKQQERREQRRQQLAEEKEQRRIKEENATAGRDKVRQHLQQQVLQQQVLQQQEDQEQEQLKSIGGGLSLDLDGQHLPALVLRQQNQLEEDEAEAEREEAREQAAREQAAKVRVSPTTKPKTDAAELDLEATMLKMIKVNPQLSVKSATKALHKMRPEWKALKKRDIGTALLKARAQSEWQPGQ